VARPHRPDGFGLYFSIDPLSPLIGTNVGRVLINARRYGEAIAQLKPIVEGDPARAWLYRELRIRHR